MIKYKPRNKTLHFCVNNITRTQGHNAVAALAYRSGYKLYCEKEDKYYNYSNKRGIVKTQICVPDHAPDWMIGYSEHYNWERFANEIEKKEDSHNRRGSALLGKDFVAAAPRELTIEQNWRVAMAFVHKLNERGLAVAVAFHQTKASDGAMNPHFHFMVAMRYIDEKGFANRYRDFDLPGKNAQAMKTLRHEYFACVNDALQDANIRNLYYDPEKQAEQIPTAHLGKDATFIEKKGFNTRVGDYNRVIAKRNRIARLEAYSKQIYEKLQYCEEDHAIIRMRRAARRREAEVNQAIKTFTLESNLSPDLTIDNSEENREIEQPETQLQPPIWQDRIRSSPAYSPTNLPPSQLISFTEQVKSSLEQQRERI